MSLSALFKAGAGFFATASPFAAAAPLLDAVDDKYRYDRAVDQRRADARILARETLKGTVEGARSSGLHPLFALGGSGAVAPGPVLPGQSNSGSSATDFLFKLMALDKATDFYEAQAKRSEARIDSQIGNDVAKAIAEGMDPMTQELEKGKFAALKDKKHPEQGSDVLRVFKKFPYGGQEIWLPVEEISDLTDNMIAVGGLAYTYHGNKNVDWPKLWYYHEHGHTEGYGTAANKRKIQQAVNRKYHKIAQHYVAKGKTPWPNKVNKAPNWARDFPGQSGRQRW